MQYIVEKNEDNEEVVRVAQGEARLAYKIVLDLAADVQEKRHVISMDNVFTSVGLFEELASLRIYATRMVRSNQIGFLLALKNRGAFRNAPHRTLE